MVGCVALLGWWLGIPALRSLFPGLATMKPNTALCFLLVGLSLWLIQPSSSELHNPHVRHTYVARVLSGLVGLIGLLTLAEYLFNLHLGIDEALFHGTLIATGVVHPGRMAGATALGFLLLGGSLVLTTNCVPYIAQGLALLASLNGFVACVGYLLGAHSLYDIPAYSSMALHTAILFLLMGLGVLAARPELGFMAAMTSEYMGGVMARRMLPLVAAVPVVFGWLRWRGQLAGVYGAEFGIALRTLAEVVTFALLLYMNATWLNRIDERGRETTERNFRLAAIVDSSDDAIFSKDLSGTITSWNWGAERLYGYRAEEVIGQPITTIIPPELRAEAMQFLPEIAGGRLVIREETLRRRKDGSLVQVSLIISPVRDFEGQIVGASIIARDITERDRAETAQREKEHSLSESQRIAHVGSWTYDLSGRMTWSEGMYRICGVSPSMFTPNAESFLDCIAPEDRPAMRHWIAACMAEQKPGDLEFRVILPEGDIRYLRGRAELQCDAENNPVQMAGTALDVTDHKRAEEELVRSRQALEDKSRMLESVLNSMSEGLVAADEHGKFILWNPAAERILGLGPADIPSQEWSDHYGVFLPDKVTRLMPEQNPLAHAIQGEATTVVLFVRNPAIRQGVFVEAYANPVRDKNGKLRGGVTAFRDITERMRSEERLREYERVVEGLEEMIVVVDRDYRYVIANRTFLLNRNLKREQVVGRRVDEIIDKKAFESVVKERMDECFRGRVVQYELKYTFPKVGERDVFASYFPIEGPTGIERIACVLEDITERKRAEEAQREAEQKYRVIFEDAVVGIFQSDLSGHYLNVNPAMARLLGYASPQDLMASITDISQQVYADPESRETFRLMIERLGIVQNFDCQVCRKDGTKIWISVNARPVLKDGVLIGYEGTNTDITERKLLEQQLLQAQKMEAVGRLAGGLAHDFNNMLGVIMGYSDLSLEMVAPDSPSYRHLSQIKKASQRAALLTRQLLAFSRQQVVFPKILDLNEVVHNVTSMLLRVVGEDVAISFQPTTPIGCIKADRGQIEQILMNLVINARDAMPAGGEIVIQTGHAELDEKFTVEHRGSGAGPHVFMTVRDTGCGMDETVQSKIFEPFFTTKEVGVGTGLGLSTVYGIVKQSGGYIVVDSAPGKGTTFEIYFPRVADKAEPMTAEFEDAAVPGGSEAILVVEDDASLRELTVKLLTDAGYRVLEAADAQTALETLLRVPVIDLLLTDVIMPGMNGTQLLEQARATHPNLLALFMSGYAGNVRTGLVSQGAFLEKPFTRRALLVKVRSVLRGESAKGQAH
jgi:PAS domain S-box-containing protein